MLFQIISLLLDVACGLLTGACLLRLYMQAQRVPFSNPVGQLVFAFTDWLVVPLRRIIPATGGWDLSCVLGAFLAQLVQYAVITLLLGGAAGFVVTLLLAVFGLLRIAVTLMMVLIIANAVLSWVQTRSPLSGVIDRLCEPVLRPIRRVVPLVGGIDLSPLVALVLLQIVMIVLGNIQMGVMH
ncbi:YggT family protein [Diaphorobacter sp.]|uniref:YggT family protein n=1 Tax=Diaphorobacter sp. TaxID=1934310 RepID=UPI0028A918F3|nr:YggT family protein [Diaphorobacter sp.]